MPCIASITSTLIHSSAKRSKPAGSGLLGSSPMPGPSLMLSSSTAHRSTSIPGAIVSFANRVHAQARTRSTLHAPRRQGRGRQLAAGPVALSSNLIRDMGLSKPSWMPDFKQSERKALLDRFYASPIRREVYEEVLDDGFRMCEQLKEGASGGSGTGTGSGGGSGATHSRFYGKADWIELMCGCVAPAIPDFTWSAATDGEVDKDGFAIVAVKVSGHHSGAPFVLPGLQPVPASGRRVTLEPELMKVRVEGKRIKEIVVLPCEGAGPLALYHALGGSETAGEA